MNRRAGFRLLAGLSVLICGCAKEDPGELVRTAFVQRPQEPLNVRRPLPEEQEGRMMYDTAGVNVLDPEGVKNRVASEEADRSRVTGLSDEFQETVTLGQTVVEPTTSPATAPSTLPVAASGPAIRPGVFMQLGAVVASVNGEPIYADKVLASLSKLLAAEAKTRDERAFLLFARGEIERQVRTFIENELEVAAARKNLDPREEALAKDLAMRWKLEQITLAEGSLEKARAKAAAQGLDFEEMVEDIHRERLVQIYYQKRLLPRVQVTAEDMRQFYNANRETMFTTRDEAEFRLIRVDASRTGDAHKAQEKISLVRQRALSGEDFAKLAGEINDDPVLKRSGGNVGTVQRGAFVLEQVEAAVWTLQPGEITEVIRIGDSFYVAKLETRKEGLTRPFEDEKVQKDIEDELRKQQINVMRQRRRQELLRDAVIFPDPPDAEPVVAMAMQNYARWSSASAR